jgi:hypothetical protein
MSSDSLRVVIELVGDAHHGLLAESRFSDKPFVPGGELNCMQLAFAAAAAGHEVELRGWLHEPTFRRFEEAAGVAPRVELEARAPGDQDIVIVPEGWHDPVEYLMLALSPARLALFVLAAPGLFGWPFTDGWSRPDPLTVEIATLARPEHFAAMKAVGFELITHSPGLVRAAAAGGVEARFVGTGLPWSQPKPAEKVVDALMLLANRWAPLAREVAGALGSVTVDVLDEAPNDEVVRRMASARTLIWPSRVEGHATIPHEARTVGCVPVALSTNPYAVGLDESRGAVVVDEVDGLAPALHALLANPSRLAELAQRARSTSREEVAWRPFVDRVADWLASPPLYDPGRPARAGAGRALRSAFDRERAESQLRLEDRFGEIEAARVDLTAATRRQEELLQEREALRAEVGQLRGELSRRPVRAAVAAGDAYRRLRRR